MTTAARPSTPLAPDVIARLDTDLLADRQAAARLGPGEWVARLRTEALEHLTQDFGVTAERAERELARELASAGVPEEVALEQIVLMQRFVIDAGEATLLAEYLAASSPTAA